MISVRFLLEVVLNLYLLFICPALVLLLLLCVCANVFFFVRYFVPLQWWFVLALGASMLWSGCVSGRDKEQGCFFFLICFSVDLWKMMAIIFFFLAFFCYFRCVFRMFPYLFLLYQLLELEVYGTTEVGTTCCCCCYCYCCCGWWCCWCCCQYSLRAVCIPIMTRFSSSPSLYCVWNSAISLDAVC